MSLPSRVRRLLSNLCLVGTLALTGCGTTLEGSGPDGCNNSCADDYDCPRALYCLDGACFGTACYASNQCAGEGGACSVGGDCCMGNCNGGVCRSSCSSGSDCASSGQCCNTYSDGKRCGQC